MREIKFRAWDAKQSVMVYDGTMWLPHERWEHRNKYRLSGVSVTSKGILWVRALKDCGPTVTVEMEGKTQHFYSDWDIQYIEKDVELMHWTGLQDKNGVDVYEGDLLRLPAKDDWDKKNFASFEVFYHGNDCTPTDVGLCLGRARFYGSLAGGYVGHKLIPRYVGKMVVIGNIYENPELLSDKR